MTLFVKLCGIVNERQLEVAVEAGADAIGFVLTPSPRQVSLEDAARMRGSLPSSILGVAVFHDPAPALLRRAQEVIEPDLLQSELSTLAGVAADRALPVVVDGHTLEGDLARAARLTTRDMVLVDSAARGGTGHSPSWERVAAVDFGGRLVLAGGLDPDNVAEAVGLVRPYGVDVSSGIETAPGVKDPARMRAFVEAARGAVSPPVGGSTAAGGEGGIQFAGRDHDTRD
jgi:phosphoribosylanthranilate isomerase